MVVSDYLGWAQAEISWFRKILRQVVDRHEVRADELGGFQTKKGRFLAAEKSLSRAIRLAGEVGPAGFEPATKAL